MIIGLDSEASLDPGRVGAKSAWLAMGRRSGLPVLPGFTVDTAASRHHLVLGAETLGNRGSGGARLVVTNEPIDFGSELVGAGLQLGPKLVARSSTTLEASGEWSGAFTSYLDVGPELLPKAVAGCWASAFSVHTLERQEAASVAPGSFLMGVLVQPSLSPEAGGTADIDDEGTVVVHGVGGSPAPLLQGFKAGVTATWDGSWAGPELIDLVGVDYLTQIANWLRKAQTEIGVNHFEWAIDGGIWILQMANTPTQAVAQPHYDGEGPSAPAMIQLMRTVVAAPGALGEEFVLPWGLVGIPNSDEVVPVVDADMADVRALSDELISEVWGSFPEQARALAEDSLSLVRGPDPVAGLERISRTHSPDRHKASKLLGLLAGIRHRMVGLGVASNEDSAWHLTGGEVDAALRGEPVRLRHRLGLGKWEPLIAHVVLVSGERRFGTPAADGLGAGRLASLGGPLEANSFAPRQVLGTTQPVPALAPLLWDASAVITASGSAAAHFFDSARSLGVPAVCGVEVDLADNVIVAVDGYSGAVATLRLEDDDG